MYFPSQCKWWSYWVCWQNWTCWYSEISFWQPPSYFLKNNCSQEGTVQYPSIRHCHDTSWQTKLRTHSIYCTPVLFSGVASLKLSSSEVTLLDQQVKITVQRLQKLQDKTPHCVCLFMGGHLPGRALYHIRMFSLFSMIARTPGSYLHKIAYYQLTCAKLSSGSWFLTLRDLCLHSHHLCPCFSIQWPSPSLRNWLRVESLTTGKLTIVLRRIS